MNSTRASLVRAYENAAYVAELPSGRVEFRLHAGPLGAAPTTPLAIITAWNPGVERPSEAANKEANLRLESVLKEADLPYYPASGHSEDGSHVEPSFAVTCIDPAAAIGLARAFRQAAVFYWDGAKPHLLWCDKT